MIKNRIVKLDKDSQERIDAKNRAIPRKCG